MDRLLPARKAAEILGLHVDDVGELRRAGRLTGVIQCVRGTKGRPRHWYAESELKRYMASLQTVSGRREVVVPKPERRARGLNLKGIREFV